MGRHSGRRAPGLARSVVRVDPRAIDAGISADEQGGRAVPDRAEEMSDSKGSTGARLPQRTGIPTRSGSIEVLVERLVGPAEPFGPGRRLTSLGSWFATRDGGTLVLAVGPEAAVDDAATATAYALAWQQDRDLVLIVPASAADSVAARLAYVATPVRLWAVDSDLSVTAVPIPSVEDVVSEARERPLRRGEAHDLGERAAWVAGLRTG